MHVRAVRRRGATAGKTLCVAGRRGTQTVARRSPGELARERERLDASGVADEGSSAPIRPTNAAGVQLLSPSLRAQLFPHGPFPPPPPSSTKLALQHLASHSLDTSRASVLSPLSFPLPPLQGPTLDTHFHRLGRSTAEPSLSLSRAFASAPLPAPPETFAVQAGWTKYFPDGSCEAIPCLPPPSEEPALCFDVETMPHYSPYPILACAASPTAWYAWISPWLLGDSSDPAHLIPFSPAPGSPSPDATRVVVGHNVSYDRARVKEEYSLHGTHNAWVDTMSLHVATHGISSHQRPAWNSYKKRRKAARERVVESVDCVRAMIRELEQEVEDSAVGSERRGDAERRIQELEEGLDSFAGEDGDGEAAFADVDEDGELEEPLNGNGKRWESATSGNSLVDVARLHCGIAVDKGARDDLLVCTRPEILGDIQTYLAYCASDVSTTHAVFRVVLPSFLDTCPSPVTWSGIMTMGSAFLPVSSEWDRYIARAEGKYKELEGGVKRNLEALAEAVRAAGPAAAEGDDWLSQLDWTLKKPRRPRGGGGGGSVLNPASEPSVPSWWWEFTERPALHENNVKRFLPLLLRLNVDGEPLVRSSTHGWVARRAFSDPPVPVPDNDEYFKLGKAGVQKVLQKRFRGLGSAYPELWERLVEGERGEEVEKEVLGLAEGLMRRGRREGEEGDGWAAQLDWSPVKPRPAQYEVTSSTPVSEELWPKWYWDLMMPKTGQLPQLDVTARSRAAPLLLKLKWQGFPLFYSRQHGWTYRVTPEAVDTHATRHKRIAFSHEDDERLRQDVEDRGYAFYKLPHKEGEEQNVGSPLAKTFVKYASDGVLSASAEGSGAVEALDMNAQCSYWISARDRVMKQVVVWQGERAGGDLGFAPEEDKDERRGIIVPQVIAMGTVTRRAIEKTWLTASNAKKNRVGSELKAMVRAPPGYSIVGADVDSEELWISSAMGDAQFGMHGATAIGWMTLEGTKAAGTDLHSKTASILGISRDAAKVFNYSRIYGAGLKHATLLMLQNNPTLLVEDAKALVERLYTSTKGQSTRTDRFFGRKFWYGGTESFLFNKLEEIALSDKPLTPALNCGVTRALTKEYLGQTDYLPSRINWVVQSSGVDYLHLLIVAMQYLIKKYDIHARYLISVHDELRYLVKEEDRYRATMALQIANLWTRCLFAFKLGIDDLPQGVGFFSAVDVDKYLRKEPSMTCVTPSQIEPLPPGESLDIDQVLKATNGGSLWPDGRSMLEDAAEPVGDLDGYVEPDCLTHRSRSPAFLRAQATNEVSEIRMLWKAEEERSSWAADRPSRPAAAAGTSTSRRGEVNSADRLAKVTRKYAKKPKSTTGKAASTSSVKSMTLELWAERQFNHIEEDGKLNA